MLKVVRKKHLKILIIDDFFSCQTKVMKLCTFTELGNTEPKLKPKFSNGHCFHGNRLIKLTKCLISGMFMKEYE